MTRDKGPIWVNLSGKPDHRKPGECTVIDINKYKLAKQAADEIDAQYKQVADNFPTSYYHYPEPDDCLHKSVI